MLSFEEWPGTLGTVTRTPDRPARSLRRTTSIRSTWPDGLDGYLALTARGRDLLTTDTGAGVVVSDARVDVRAEGFAKTVRSITSEPAVPHLPLLEGVNLASGFRRAVATNLVLGEGSVLALLLDDLPGAALVSGSARLRATIEATGELPGFTNADLPVVCIGRRRDGVMAQRRSEGRPLIGQGPPAGHLDRPDDPLAWPPEPPLPVHGMRRLRRIDVAVVEDEIIVDTHFRDSYQESSGIESSVHEYEVLVSAGALDRKVRTVEVRPASLARSGLLGSRSQRTGHRRSTPRATSRLRTRRAAGRHDLHTPERPAPVLGRRPRAPRSPGRILFRPGVSLTALSRHRLPLSRERAARRGRLPSASPVDSFF